MPYCPSCGAEIGDHVEYCQNCGARVSVEKTKIHSEPIEQMPQKPSVGSELPELVQRNYIIWLILSIFTGIFGIIYLFIIIEDLNKLDKYPRPTNVPSTKIDTTTIIIWLVAGYLTGILLPFAMAYTYHQIFGKLHNYIVAHPQKQTKNTVSGSYITKYYIFLYIFVFLMTACLIAGSVLFTMMGYLTLYIALIVVGGLISLIVSGMGIYMYILQYKWQEAFNERVRIINPNARMVDLF